MSLDLIIYPFLLQETKTKKADTTKMTKHGFLDKIKNTAASLETRNDTVVEEKLKIATSNKEAGGKWNALKDDFMMKPKKNWDEESSSDEEEAGDELPDDAMDPEGVAPKRRKLSVR